MKYYIILWITFFSIHTYAQTYRGMVGKYPILLELDTAYENHEASAFYAYESQLRSIPLEGNLRDTELVLYKLRTELEEKQELFKLKMTDTELKGTWQHNDKVLEVRLTIADEDYRTFRLGKIEYVRDSISVHGNKELVWFIEKYSNKKLFRLGNGFTKQQRGFFNPKLDAMHESYAESGLDCEWADFTIEIKKISDNYIGFVEHSSTYCGGIHPNYYSRGYNFGLVDNKILEKITDVYPNLDYYKLLEKKYKNNPDLQEECGYFTDDYSIWEYYSWVLTNHGAEITPSYPHAMRPCEESFLLTNRELEEGL